MALLYDIVDRAAAQGTPELQGSMVTAGLLLAILSGMP